MAPVEQHIVVVSARAIDRYPIFLRQADSRAGLIHGARNKGLQLKSVAAVQGQILNELIRHHSPDRRGNGFEARNQPRHLDCFIDLAHLKREIHGQRLLGRQIDSRLGSLLESGQRDIQTVFAYRQALEVVAAAGVRRGNCP